MSSVTGVPRQTSKSSMNKIYAADSSTDPGAAAANAPVRGASPSRNRISTSSQRPVDPWSLPANVLASGETWLGALSLRGWSKRHSGRLRNTEVYYKGNIMQYKPGVSQQLMRIDGHMWVDIKREQFEQDHASPGTVHPYRWVIYEELGAPTYIYRKYLAGTKKENILPPLKPSTARRFAHAIGM